MRGETASRGHSGWPVIGFMSILLKRSCFSVHKSPTAKLAHSPCGEGGLSSALAQAHVRLRHCSTVGLLSNICETLASSRVHFEGEGRSHCCKAFGTHGNGVRILSAWRRFTA